MKAAKTASRIGTASAQLSVLSFATPFAEVMVSSQRSGTLETRLRVAGLVLATAAAILAIVALGVYAKIDNKDDRGWALFGLGFSMIGVLGWSLALAMSK